LTTGDHLWADEDSRAEMHIRSTAPRLDSRTAFAFLNLDDRTVQIRLPQGSLNIGLRNLGEEDVFEIDTPNGAISLLRNGNCRIGAEPDQNRTNVTVRGGDAESQAAGQAIPVHARQEVRKTENRTPHALLLNAT
jgi:hypothetical protein